MEVAITEATDLARPVLPNLEGRVAVAAETILAAVKAGQVAVVCTVAGAEELDAELQEPQATSPGLTEALAAVTLLPAA